MIFDRTSRSCSGCEHWSRYPKVNPDGYLEAICQQPKDDRDHELKRAADICSKWNKRSEVSAIKSLVIEF